MHLRDEKTWIKFNRPTKGSFSLGIENTARDHRDPQAIEGRSAVRLQLRRALCEVFRIGKTPGVYRSGPRLDQNKTERDQRVGIVRSYLDCFTVSIFGFVPPLLIHQHISESMKCARVARL